MIPNEEMGWERHKSGLWDHTSPANSSFHLLPPFSHILTHMASTELNLIVKLSGFQDQMLSKEEQTGSSEGWDVRGLTSLSKQL